ncbi:MAG: alpha/beta hydrolase [Leptolyngbya sp. SIO1D8]|nr:alpha/beta hydrolase [Leptolyngbya sp. SIO1D8]
MTTLPIRNSRIRLTQGSLFWREVGYGPTLLFLHGNWQDSSQWVALMEQLGRQFHCIAPDLLGFGESSRLAKRKYSIALEVECLTEYLTSLRTQPHVIVADAIGAWVAVCYSLQHPDAVQGLIFMAPEGLADPILDQRWQRLRWLASAWSIRVWALRLAIPLLKLVERDRWLLQIWRKRQKLLRYAAACQLLFQRRPKVLQSEQLNNMLPQLKTPVLILHPQRASSTTKLANTIFHELAPNTQLATLPEDEAASWETATDIIQAFMKTEAMNTTQPYLR